VIPEAIFLLIGEISMSGPKNIPKAFIVGTFRIPSGDEKGNGSAGGFSLEDP
jgi:hypothetical protein